MIYNMGWAGFLEEREAWQRAVTAHGNNGLKLYHEFSDYDQDLLRKRIERMANRPYTWDLERRLFEQKLIKDRLIPTYTQDTGNCVAAALVGAGQKLQVIEIALLGQEERYRPWYIPFIYAVSRNQIGGGKINGAGSTGAWAARAVNEYGVLFEDDEGVPPTAGYSDKWGDRWNKKDPEYARFFDIASDNKLEVIRCLEVDHLVKCLDAGMQATIASYQGFKVVERYGLHVYLPSGQWAHQMHFTDIRRDPRLMFYRMNQWGPDHAKPLNGETPGGAWYSADYLAEEWTSRVEVYAYSRFQGDPSGPRHDFI